MRRITFCLVLCAFVLVAAIPGTRTLDYLGTCNLDMGWSHEDGTRLGPLFPDQAQVGTPFVVPALTGGYTMVYAAGNGSWAGIYAASSPDSVNWTHGSTPLVKALDFGVAN